MVLHTERLIIRHFTMDDLSDFHEIFSDPVVMEYIEPAYDLEQSRKFLEDFCVGQKKAVAAVLRESGKVIGYKLFKDFYCPEIREIGWIYNKDYWRQGFALEAAHAVIKYGFEELGLHKITAEAVLDNSVGLMKKLGMTHEGTLRKNNKYIHSNEWLDLHIYGVLAEEWGK